MSDVRLSSTENSTIFTTCCGVAILESQERCPGCSQLIYPFYEGMTDEEREGVDGSHHHHDTRMARWRRAYRGR